MSYQVYELVFIIIIQWLSVGIPVIKTANGTHFPESCHHKEEYVVSYYQESRMNEVSLPFTSNYTTLLFLNDETLLVGARNYILSFNVTDQDLILTKSESWVPEASMSQITCIHSGFPKEDCYNFIKVLSVANSKLLCCGTNSYYPECTWRNVTNLEQITSSFYGKGFAPFRPNSKSTYVFADDGRFFSGCAAEFGGYKTIFAAEFDNLKLSRVLRVLKNDIFLDDPIFHRSFLIGEYIYFFFDEFARECTDCDAVRYSRVGRICKGDDGGTEMFFLDNFVTFQKARLNCSLGGPYPFYYNILRDIYWDPESKTFYGVFTTERSHKFHSSAVCSYSLQDIERVFSGTFRIKQRDTLIWVTKRNPGHIKQCKVNPKSARTMTSSRRISGRMRTNSLRRSSLAEHHQFILTSSVVQSRLNTASFHKRNIRFLKVVAVTFQTKGETIEVWYVATDRGTILKLSRIPLRKTLCVFEEYHIFQTDKSDRILEIKLSPNKEYLLVGSDNKITKLHLLKCDRHVNKRSCIEAKDPLCGWSTNQGKCNPWNRRNNEDWEQSMASCPQREAQWSHWSSWEICERNDGNLCRCRKRTCLFARHGYKCNGSDVELTNCTANRSTLSNKKQWLDEGVVHGGWSLWSEWSICFRGFKNRSRNCDNPSPNNGGLKCSESSLDYSLCEPAQYDGNVTYLWTSWNRVRGPERKARRYKISCTSKAVVMKSLQIDVEDTETINCTEDLCIEPVVKPQHLITDWSDWLSCNHTIDKIRTRQLCAINISNHSWSCEQHDVERNFTSTMPSVSCVGSSNALSTTTSSFSTSSISGISMANSVNKRTTTKTLIGISNESSLPSFGSVYTPSSTVDEVNATTTSTTNEATMGSQNISRTDITTITSSTSKPRSTSMSSKVANILPTTSTSVVCVTTVISTASPQNTVTESPHLLQWSPCVCDHNITLPERALGIQHRTRSIDGTLVNEYKTCFCKVLPAVTTIDPELADIEAFGNDKETGKFSLKMVLTIVIVCCLTCVALTAILLTVFYHKKSPLKKGDNNNQKVICTDRESLQCVTAEETGV